MDGNSFSKDKLLYRQGRFPDLLSLGLLQCFFWVSGTMGFGMR